MLKELREAEERDVNSILNLIKSFYNGNPTIEVSYSLFEKIIMNAFRSGKFIGKYEHMKMELWDTHEKNTLDRIVSIARK